jgi:hypothetical protein
MNFIEFVTKNWPLIAGIAFAVIVVVVLIIVFAKKGGSKEKYIKVAETPEEVEITLKEEDIVLTQGKTYSVGKGKDVPPGLYTLLASNNSGNILKIRLKLVQDYKHGVRIVLAEGEEITPVSESIILRK